MTFYPPNPGRGPFPPGYRQNFGPPGYPAPFGRQVSPNPVPQFRAQPPFYQQPYPMGRPGNPFFSPSPFGNQGQPFLNQNQFGMQDPNAYYPNQQFRGPGLSGHLNTLMGHVGTVTNGVNMLRQLGSLMTLFR
ncbi:hypothetical protein [Lysinibacillus odysseyi]|uniref:hypothetical protein n=1 Tax=Lysinibacillus odysseyi TaxID=202611 RepID=UPI00056AB307|nr:hypothetical protein [Lysinibacillus odysseyi]